MRWAYSLEELAVYRTELTIAPEDVVPRRTHVIEERSQIVGFYTLRAREPGAAELEHIFIEPDYLGQGFGRILFHHACEVARDAGFRRLVIQNDPNSSGFFHAVGAQLERHIPSSIPGGTIPYFTVALGGGAA
jgi:N-acetylglutamate synthase-like GNAT family acetyltransferase